MSYDLMVFRKDAAPQTRADFMNWFDQQTEWDCYDDPLVACTELKNWFFEMIQNFPAMNGPFAIDIDDDDDVDPKITGYSIGRDSIYIDFRWSVAEQAYDKVFELAGKHGVGFFDVSSNEGAIFFPENGKLRLMDEPDKKNPINRGGKTEIYSVETIVKVGGKIDRFSVNYEVGNAQKTSQKKTW